ncbi:phosphate:Na+ symporter [Halopseudomonas sabulinigri]|uniref:Phosphate:Na+ symporter n=1 Tax=Halopseudomonas sabulinigri TaxID=472181 RepID=A0A1H1UL57_9GAMM|nr:Na/Pi symporter [Halopseudomonas sabulinigri]SDS73193.1 phosphate:Na+ symporter [Halopseudomonas sabulinigri]
MPASRSIRQRLVSLQPAWLIAALAGFVLLFFGNNAFSLLLAGIALFILGMRYLENGFRAFTGGALERWLTACTSSVWKSLLFGGVTTALVQSSSLITLLSIAFLSAGLISLTAGIGIVFGANLGTTTGAWLIALIGLKVDLSQIAMPMLVLGVILERNKSASWRGGGQVLLGVGLLFLGIDQMKLGFAGMDAALNLSVYAASGWQSLLLYAALGTLATVLMQSSHATLMITLTALAGGQLGYLDALAMAVGANLGTTITALIAAFSANNAGRQLAAAHIVFNLLTAMVALAILPLLAQWVDTLSSWLGIDEHALTLKLALFHTLFNLLGLLIMLPLVPLLVRSLQRWLPAAVEPDEELSQQPRSSALYLNDAALLHADTALRVLQQELAHLASLSHQVIAAALYLPADFMRDVPARQNLSSRLSIPPLAAREDADALYHRHIKGVYGDIIAFRSRLDCELLPQQQQQLMDDMLSARDLVEAVKAAKHLQGNLRKYVDSQRPALREGYRQLREQGRSVLSVLASGSAQAGVAAERGSAALSQAQQMFSAGFERQLHEQLRSGELDGWQATSLLNDLNYLKQIGDHLRAAHDMIYTRAALRAAG